ncbi:TetR/AcrR family transcriptional regulator [Amycolatopsis anabasis]|uniref:TetR/AcrR family transcriptional regulator n=1 Tax=Amycolatopsis anabasis TaxID=1840409 RepID=UPI00131E5A3D|nr:TetR/AcrR family transcriptional regulator [Amycolatopsis anabasis]
MDSSPGARERLISTAVTLLAEEGIEAVKLRRIARAAGVSHGAPLRHFTGRAELLSAVATTGFRELRRRGRELPPGAPRDRLRAACRAYLDFALGDPAMFELMFRHDLVDAHEPELAAANSAVFDLFGELVAAVQAEGWRAGTETRLLTGSLWAALHGLAELWLWGGLSTAAPDPDAALSVTLDVFLEGERSDVSSVHPGAS